MGEDGIEGLARKLTSGIQTSTQEEIAILDAELEFFVKKLGGTKHFSLSVLRKSDAYKRLMKHRLGSVEPFKHGLQKDFIVLFKRLINTEPCMERPLRATEESITFFNQFSARLESLQDLFSEQIGINDRCFGNSNSRFNSHFSNNTFDCPIFYNADHCKCRIILPFQVLAWSDDRRRSYCSKT